MRCVIPGCSRVTGCPGFSGRDQEIPALTFSLTNESKPTGHRSTLFPTAKSPGVEFFFKLFNK